MSVGDVSMHIAFLVERSVCVHFLFVESIHLFITKVRELSNFVLVTFKIVEFIYRELTKGP